MHFNINFCVHLNVRFYALNNWSMCSAADMVGESYVLVSSPGRTFNSYTGIEEQVSEN